MNNFKKSKSQLNKIIHYGHKNFNLLQFYELEHDFSDLKSWNIMQGTKIQSVLGTITGLPEVKTKGWLSCAYVINYYDLVKFGTLFDVARIMR